MRIKDMNPSDVMARNIALEYLRKVGADRAYEKSSPTVKSLYFYRFEVEGKTGIDFNWEQLFFETTMTQIEALMKPLEEDILHILEQEAKKVEEVSKQASINLMDLAATEIAKSKKLNIPEIIV